MEHLNVIFGVLFLQLLAVISPGPNFAIVSRLSVAQSKASGLGAALGISLGATSYAILTIMGLSALLEHVAWLTHLVQILGGCYLVYLGIAAWLRGNAEKELGVVIQSKAFSNGFRSGLLVSLSNPKAIAFFVGLYAVAVPMSTPVWAKVVIVLGGFTLEALWYIFVSLVLSLPAPKEIYQRFTYWIERGFGSFLALLGVRLIWQNLRAVLNTVACRLSTTHT